MVPVRLTTSPSLISAVRAEDHDADIVRLEVERHALHAIGELDHLAGLDIVEAVDAGDAVADAQHGADFADLRLGAEIGDLVLDDLGNLCGVNVHFLPFSGPLRVLRSIFKSDGHIRRLGKCEKSQPFIAWASEFKRVRSEPSIIWLPILTTRPPMMAGSTVRSRAMSRPVRAFSCLESAVTCVLLSGEGGRNVRARLALVGGEQRAIVADDFGKLAQAAIVREHAERLGGEIVQLERGGHCRDRLGRRFTPDQRALGQRPEIRRSRPAPPSASQDSPPPNRAPWPHGPARRAPVHSAPQG